MRRESNDLQRDISDDFKKSFDKIGRDSANHLASGFEKAAPRVQRATQKVADSADVARLKQANLRLEQKKAEGTARDLARAEDALSRAREQGVTDAEKLARLEKTVDSKRIAAARTTARLTKAEVQYSAALRDTADAHAALNQIERGSAGNAVAQVDNLAASVGRLGKMGGPVAVAAISAGLVQLTGIAASAAQSVALLPGVIGSAAAGFGTLKLGMAGFGDALENLRDPEAFSESLRSLSPNAQQAAVAIRGLLPEFDRLKTATQDALFAGIGPMLQNLSGQYMPMITQLTTQVGSAFNTMFAGVANQLMTPETQTAMQNFANNTAAAFQALAPAMGPLVKAFAEITSVGSEFLPELARSAASAAEEFARFIDEASKSGDLKQFIQEGVDTLKLLGSIVGNVSDMFFEMAPIGRTVLPPIANSMENIANATGPVVDMVIALKPALDVMGDAAAVATGDFGKLGDVIGGVAGIAESMANRVGLSIDRMMDPLRSAIEWANGALPGDPIPNIPHFGGGNAGGGSGFGNTTPAPGLPSAGAVGTMGSLVALPGSMGSGALAGINTQTGWGPGRFDGLVTGPEKVSSGGSSAKNSLGEVPNNVALQEALREMFPGLTFASDTGRQDSYGEHASGEALDIMVPDLATGDRLNEWLLANAEAFDLQYNLWRQASWDPDGTVKPMPDRGSPTQNHMDHVHARVSPGAADGSPYMPVGYTAYEPGTQRVTVDSFGSSASSTLQQTIGAPLDQDFGISKGLSGIFENLTRAIANLAMAPVLGALSGVTAAFGTAGPGSGLLGALAPRENIFGQAMPNVLGQYPPTALAALPGVAPMGAPLPGSPNSPGIGNFGTPHGISSLTPSITGPVPVQAGQSYPTPTLPGQSPLQLAFPGSANTGPTGIAMGQGKPASPGFGIGGGLIGAAQSAGGAAMGGMPGGAAMSAGAQIGIDLINRTIGLAGQVAGIGVEGLMETFLPVGSELADPSRGWFGKILGAVAGVRPAADNIAGNLTESQQPLSPEQAEAGKAEDRGKQAAELAQHLRGGDTYNVTNHRQMNDFNAKDLARYAAGTKNGR